MMRNTKTQTADIDVRIVAAMILMGGMLTGWAAMMLGHLTPGLF